MTSTAVSVVLDKLFAREIALRPHWYQPGAPRECWLFVARAAAWLIVWDPTVRRVESATRYTESALRERLPQLTGAQVFDHSIVAYSAVDPALGSLATAFVTARDDALNALRSTPRSSVRSTLTDGATIAHLLFSDAIGWNRVIERGGSVVSHTPIDEDYARGLVAETLFAGGSLSLEPVDPALLATLEQGERRYLALREEMRAGALGWGVHGGLTVIEVDGKHYNTAFAGETATSFTVFRAGYLLGEMLQRSTASDARPAAAKALTAAQFASARTLVAKQSMSAEELLAKMQRGELSIAGGGPTSEDRWSLEFVGDRFELRSAVGEALEKSRDEVLALLARRGFTTMYWR